MKKSSQAKAAEAGKDKPNNEEPRSVLSTYVVSNVGPFFAVCGVDSHVHRRRGCLRVDSHVHEDIQCSHIQS